MAFEDALEFTLRWEGGYVDHPSDPGGETNWGISKRSYPDVDIKNLTRFQAAEIYRRDYWEKVRGDSLPAPLALAVFDYAVNSGPRRAVTALQSLLGAKQDGSVGPKTLAALKGAEADDQLLERYILERVNFLIALNKPQFLRGWMRRVVSLSIEAGKLLA